MKKIYIFLITLIFSTSGFTKNANDFAAILDVSDVPTVLCANESFTLSYTFSGATINGGNEFRAQISDNTGIFSADPSTDIIGFITSNASSETIYVTIPYNTPTLGAGYRIRVIATNTSDLVVFGNANLSGAIDISCVSKDYYWIGGTGNWSDLTHWEYTVDGGTTFTNPADILPDTNDNANFDTNSFPVGGTLNFDQFIDINDFYWEPGSGTTNPVIIANGNTLRLKGELVLDAGIVTNFGEIQFTSTKKYLEINYADNILGSPNVGGVSFSSGGSWELNSNMSASQILIHNGSEITTNDYQLNINGSIWANGEFGNTLNTGSSEIYLQDLTTNDMMVIGNAIWHFNSGGGIGKNVSIGTVIIESGDYYIDNNVIIDELIMGPGSSLIISDIDPLSVVSNFEAIGTRDKLITIKSSNLGVQATLNITPGAAFIADFVNIEDNIITGSTPYSATNWVENGNNTGWDFSVLNQLTGLNYYWVGGTGDWSDYSAHWAKLPGGGGFRASPPGAADNIIFTSASFPGGGTLTVDEDVLINTMDWQAGSGVTSPRLRGSNTTITMSGDITLDNGVRRSVNFDFQTSLGETQNIDFADNLFESGNISLTGLGTWELLSDLEIDQINLNGGTFNSNNHQIDVVRIYINDNTAISNWGSSTVNLNDLRNQTGLIPAFNASSTTFNFGNVNKTYTNIIGPVSLGTTNVLGELTIDNNNIFTSLTIEKGTNITIEQNTTQLIDVGGDFTALGLRDQPITIKSDNPGVLASFSQTSGTNASSFLIIEDVNTLGALSISTDYSTYNGTPLSGGTLFNGWVFGQFLDTPLDFYWVGNSGNWSDYTNHWATSADGSTMHVFAPGLGDNVFFSPNSFTIVGQAVTLDNPVNINNMTWEFNSGLNSPTITAVSSGNTDNTLTIQGDLTMDNGVQRNINKLIFESAATQNIDFADNIGTFDYPDGVTFRGGGTWNLLSDVDTYDLNIEDATVNTNDNDFTVSNGLTLLSGTSNLDLGFSFAYLKNINDNTGGTAILNATNSSIFIDEYANLYGNFSLNNVQVLNGGTLNIGISMLINDLTLDPGSWLIINAGETLTTNTFSASGTSGSPIKINSNISGSQGFISQAAGIINATNILISDNDASGVATFNLANSLVIGNVGNVTGWNIAAATANQYNWLGGTGDWSDITHWEFSIDGGTSFNPAITPPGVLDDVFFKATSFTGPGERVEINQNAYCHNMVWTTSVVQSPTLSAAFDIQLTVFGSFILANGVKRAVQEMNFESYVAGNIINMADNQTAGIFEGIDFKGTGEWTLMSDFKGQEVNFRGGTFNMNGFDLYVDDWSFNNGDPKIFNAGASQIYAGRFIKSSASIDLTYNQGSSTLHLIDISNENSKITGPFIFNDVIIEAIDASIKNSNAFNSLTVNDGVTLQLEDNSIQSVFDLALNGLSGSPVIIESTNPGVQGTFNVPLLGSVAADYVIFTDNNAAGSATFNATNSSQISNVTGWSGLKQGQTINFLPLNDITLSETIDLAATASSGLTVTYSVIPLIGSGTIATDVLNPSTTGLVAVVASQAGDPTYGPAQDVIQYVHLNEGIFANELGQMKEATIAVGAANGVSEGSDSFTDKSVDQALQAIVSPDGKLIVAGESRVMIWNEIPGNYDVPADVVVGQLDFTSEILNPSQTILAPETNDFFTGGAAIGPNGELIVSDGRGVLIWNSIPTTNGAPADVIIGQANFTATAMDVTQDKFLAPVGVAVSTDGKLIVADIAANRVLIYNTIPTSNGALADVVIGQPDFTSSTAGTSQQSLNFPSFVTVSSDNKLLIADVFNNRILVYNTIPTTNNALADVVIGQDDFTTNSTGVAGNAFNIPLGVAISKTGKLAITDLFNARVLIYNQIPANNSTLADLVLGQPDFDTSDPVNEDEISLRDISSPFGVSWDLSENLIITDTRLDRVLVYGAADLTAPTAFTTGSVVSVGGIVSIAYFNGSNTGLDISVPLDNDISLEGGAVQLQIKFGAGTFSNIGPVTTILNSDLGTTLVKSVSASELQAAIGYAEGAIAMFRAVITDIVNNKTNGTESSTTITIDTSAPLSFTTGTVLSLGGTISSGYWNSTNTSLDVSTPIDNDNTLVGGSLQLQAKIGVGSFTNIGIPINIVLGDLGTSILSNTTSTVLIALPNYTEGESIVFRSILDDIAANQTISTESSSSTFIDTTAPPLFSVDNIAVAGGTIISGVWNSTNTSIAITVPVENEPSITGGSIQLQVRFGAAPFIDIETPYTVALSDLGTNKTINISKAVFETTTGYLNGQSVEFNAIKTDIAGNQTSGTLSGTTLLINESATVVFTTGTALTIGGVVSSTYFNGSNTSIEIEVPIQDDPTLDGGSVQMQAKIGSGSFIDIGNSPTITTNDLGNIITITLSNTEIESLTDFAQNANITFRATIINNIGSQIVGAESNSIFTIDTILPTDFTATFGTIGVNSNDPVQGYWNANTTGIDFNIPLDNDASLENGTIQLQIDVDENGYNNIGSLYTILFNDLSNTVSLIINKSEFEAATGIAEGSIIDFEVIITDIAGNITNGTISNNMLTVDRVAPALGSNLPSVYSIGSTTQPSVTLNSDVSGIKEVTFSYNLVSSSDPELFTTIVLTPDNTENYIANLKDFISTNTEQIGLIYYFTVSDNAGNIFNGTKKPINVKYPDGLSISKFGVGSTSDKYRMISVPLDLESNTLNNIFDEIYTDGFDKSKMRIFSYPGGGSKYSELTGSSKLDIGVGYIALASSNTNVTSPIGVTSFETVSDAGVMEIQGFTINLVPGWNLIGNPYLHSVKWSDIKALSQVLDSDLDAPQIFDGNSYSTVTSIPIGEAAFVFNNLSTNVLLKIPTTKPIGGRIGASSENKNSLANSSWKAVFTAKDDEGSKFELGGFGMEVNADVSKDQYDILNPPALNSLKAINFMHPEYSASSFKNDIRPTVNQEIWKFEYNVENTDINKHTISWDNSYFGDDSPELYLVDKSHFATIDMKEVNSYTFSHTGTTQFEVYFGYDAIEEILPDELITQSPFPNPFTNEITFNIGLPKGDNYSVEIRIFNSLGKEIKMLAPKQIELGYTSISWNGLGKNGNDIPTGIYTYTMHIIGNSIDVIKTGKIVKQNN